MGAFVLTRSEQARIRHAARALGELQRLRELKRLLRAAEAAVAAGEDFDDWLARELRDAMRPPPEPAPASTAGRRCAIEPRSRPSIPHF